MSAAKPSKSYCTCRGGYKRKYSRSRKKRGWYCMKKAGHCHTYNVKTLSKGSKNYACVCKRGYTVHYYRYNGTFYKSCMKPKKSGICSRRSRVSCMESAQCNYVNRRCVKKSELEFVFLHVF